MRKSHEQHSERRAKTKAEQDAFLAEYRKQDTPPSEEELFEMRAAFGEDTEVVNVFTGRKTKL